MKPRIGRAASLVVLALASCLPRAALAQREVVVPAETVIGVRLEDGLSTKENRVGDRFKATLGANSRSGFPMDTKFEGAITEVQRPSSDRPGMLDMEIREAVLPDGTRVRLDGRLASLAREDVVRTSDGRAIARKQSGGKKRPDWKWAGYGAGGGAVLSAILGGNILKGVLIGGAGGAIFSYLTGKKGKENYRDVDLPRGTRFGIRLNQEVAFRPAGTFKYASRDARELDDEGRVLANRQEGRFPETTVRLDGQDVQFADAHPMYVNGRLYVPLAPVARAAHMRLDSQPDNDDFLLVTPSGDARGIAGDSQVSFGNGEPITLEDEPVSLNGVIYVSGEYLSRVAGLGVREDQSNRRLELETYR